MRLKIVIIAEDHHNRVKSTRDGYIDIPDHMLQEGNSADRVRQLAEWGLNEAGQYLNSQFQPQQQHFPGPIQMAHTPAPQKAYGGWQPGQGPPPPFLGEGAPTRGTPAPLDRRRVPRTAEQMIATSSEGLRRAVEDDKRRGASFVIGQENRPARVNNHVGWGPHRHK
jgi:hypothetical protein